MPGSLPTINPSETQPSGGGLPPIVPTPPQDEPGE